MNVKDNVEQNNYISNVTRIKRHMNNVWCLGIFLAAVVLPILERFISLFSLSPQPIASLGCRCCASNHNDRFADRTKNDTFNLCKANERFTAIHTRLWTWENDDRFRYGSDAIHIVPYVCMSLVCVCVCMRGNSAHFDNNVACEATSNFWARFGMQNDKPLIPIGRLIVTRVTTDLYIENFDGQIIKMRRMPGKICFQRLRASEPLTRAEYLRYGHITFAFDWTETQWSVPKISSNDRWLLTFLSHLLLFSLNIYIPTLISVVCCFLYSIFASNLIWSMYHFSMAWNDRNLIWHDFSCSSALFSQSSLFSQIRIRNSYSNFQERKKQRNLSKVNKSIAVDRLE